MTHTTTLRTLMTMPEAAAHLGCSVRTLERRIVEGVYTVTHAQDGRRLVDMTDAVGTDKSALLAEVRVAGDAARQQAMVLAQALERITATHEAQVSQLQASADAARVELAGAKGAIRRRTWVAGVAASVAAALCVSLTHTHTEAQKQGATLRHVSDRLTQAEARAEAAEARAIAAEASEGATRRAALTHTRPWWAVLTPSESAGP